MTAAVMFSTPNHKMVASHHYMGDFAPSRLNDSFLQKVICSTPNFAHSTPITPSSVAHTTVSKYVNMGTIGEGSYGLVLKCKERQTGRIVAIKKFIESEEDKSVRKIAMREIHLLKQLRHENLVNLLEVFRRKSRLYLVFEFVEKSLLDHLELSPNGLEGGQCRRILYQVIRAVEFCHIHNDPKTKWQGVHGSDLPIIHRDVKPENILISKHGVVKLCDFGFARTLAKPGEIYTEYVSTRWYRAPELLVGDARYGRAVDIWALGCLSAEMMTGQPLFPGDSDIDQLFSIVKCFGGLCTRHEDRLYSNPMFRFEISQIEVTEPLKCRIRGCSSREFQFVASCLELDPQDRPTCSALLRHPLFTCDGFTSWFPDELEEMLRRDADEHKLPTEAPRPKRLLPDLKKCILLNSSTPIKGSSTHPFNLFAQSTNHHQPPNSYNNDCPQDKVATTHRNLEKAFGNCVANDDHDDDDDDDDVKSPHNDSGHDDDERFNFDLRPQDTYDLRLPDSSAISDLDLSFSHLGIREGVELEGEESSRKLMNINEYGDDDDYEEAANGIYNYYAHHNDDVYGNKQHPVSVQPINYKDDYNKNNDYNNNNKNNYNNNNNNRKQQSSSKIKSLSSSSSSSSSSAMTSLPSSSSSSSSSASSKKSSASTSGVSSPSSSSSTSSLNNNNHHYHQQHKNNCHNNKNNYSPINNNNNNNNNYYNNYYYYNHNKTGANNNNSSSNNVQSHKGSNDANHKSQNQKFPQHSTSKNYKSQQQDQTRTQHKPLQPLQQKNNNQQYNQQQHHYKQAENESPKPVQRSTQQQHKQQQQQQQNFQSKAAKKKSNFDACKPPQKQTAPKFSTNQTKIGFKHS